ncbi:hypothetical protein A0H81_01888 [Grifola frondosa]|uniref:Uncharacterized protein n=1 Tax=Grifola frondosa TaxID=5627 RepID=A0A1C7MML9_GRIFR|nr:hypothetical protein A0H81_01888 [Grifola frondosa]
MIDSLQYFIYICIRTSSPGPHPAQAWKDLSPRMFRRAVQTRLHVMDQGTTSSPDSTPTSLHASSLPQHAKLISRPASPIPQAHYPPRAAKITILDIPSQQMSTAVQPASPAPTPGAAPPDTAGSQPQNTYEYPPQRHAGAVGYGPEYGKGASTGDKLSGLQEEMVGKLLHNPEKVQHGRDLRTGELKRREKEDDANPFGKSSGGDDTDKDRNTDQEVKGDTDQPKGSPPAPEGPSEKGAEEQAATTVPEGTH